MALSCLTGASNPLTTSRPSCPGSTASSSPGALEEGAEPTSSTPSTSPIIEHHRHHHQSDHHNGEELVDPNTIAGTTNGMNDQHHGGSGGIMSAPSPVNGPAGSGAGVVVGGLPSLAGSNFQQQQQQQQAALAAAGLFRLGSGYPAGIVPPHHLPSLMASLQAVAGVPLHHGPLPAGLGGLLPGGLPFNFPSMSHQHQNALLNWSKLAQAAALGVAVSAGHHHHVHHDGLGSLIAHQQQHSPDSSSSGRSGSKKKHQQANLGYTAGLIVKEATTAGGLSNKKAGSKTVKAQVARRNAKNSSNNKALLDLETTDSGKLIIEPPIMVSSPVGTSSPPSINGSSGGSGLHNKSSSGSSTRSNTSAAPAMNGSSGDSSIIKADGSGGKVFSCSICHRTFGYKHVLQNHERTHTGEKPFECKQCGKRFTRDHHLKTHMRLHTGEKPYNCTHCDRQFVQVANLRRHLRVHTGERPYACELCTSRFSDSNQLKAHMLIHKGEKPFECQLCSGKFRRRHHLMHHKCPKDPAKHLVSKMLSSIHHQTTTTEDDMESEPPPTPSSYASPPDEEEEDEEDELLMDDEEELSVTPKKPARERKPKETRRVIRGGHQPAAPEQTEPEDLSNKTSSGSAHRIRHASTFSVGSTGGWSAAGSISIGLSTDEEDELLEDDMSDTEDIIIQRASKKQRRGIDPVAQLQPTHQV